MAAPISLFALTLQKGGGINDAIYGNFSRPKIQEIVVARGKVLELLRPDDDTGKMQTICSTEVFGVLRSLTPFRLVGGNRDFIIAGSDSGRLVILQFNPDKNRFDKVHEETYGKSGCRRIVPGQYLAVDPKGRAAMIGAIERQKFVYVLNRDSAANLTISSPLEAHKSHAITYALCGVDVGFENPIFAALETDYEMKVEDVDPREAARNLAAGRKSLTFYELDLGLNHVTRKWSERIDDRANMLLTVPGGNDGPGGVLILAENTIHYKNQEHKTISCPLPRRVGLAEDRGVLVVSTATHTQKDLFFFFIQTEFGDIYKVTLEHDEETVTDIVVKYFDTVPVSVALCVLKTGFLFCASEFGNHHLFQITGLGDDDDTPFASAQLHGSEREDVDEGAEHEAVFFSPRKITNLELIDEMDSLSPITDFRVADLAKELTPQIYALCGQGHRSSLRVLRHGLAVSEMAVSELPGNPNAVWAVKRNASDEFMSYIVVSFLNATIVLSIGETVVEVTDSGILDSTPTLSLSLLGENSLLQIHPNGLRHIRADKRIHEWKAPAGRMITRCAVNERQVVIALRGGEMVYFELDKTGQLMDITRKELGSEITSLAVAPVAEGRQRAAYMVVGSENAVRVLSLDPRNLLEPLTLQALPAVASSLALVPLAGAAAGKEQTDLYLYVGLENGVLIRTVLDEASGSLADARKRFLGTKPVRLSTVQIQGRNALLAMSSRPWVAYTWQGRVTTTPLSYDELQGAAAFSSPQCMEGIVCIAGNTLRIVTLERLGEMFNQTVFPLRYTPRKMVINPRNNHIIIIETDNNSYSYAKRKELQALFDEGKDTEMEQKGEEAEESKALETFISPLTPGLGKWASCIRIFDPATGTTVQVEELEENEAALSMALITFGPDPKGEIRSGAGGLKHDETFLVVGTAKDMVLAPRSMSSGYILVYRFKTPSTIELLHRTPVHDVPLAFGNYQKKLLAGVGNVLRLYDLGKKKVLRKAENKGFPTAIQSITVVNERIFVGDMSESVQLCMYRRAERQLIVVADTTNPRFLTSLSILDYDTVAGADKFGNIFITRLPQEVSLRIDKDPTGGRSAVKHSTLNSAHNKFLDIVQFHVGDTVTSLQKASLVPGGTEVIVFSTVMGGLGVLIPFAHREDVEFFLHLEMHMRQELPPLCGRDHLAYRSYYFPVKDCVDGDLAEMYTTLDYDQQKAIADELVSSPPEVAKKLEELRNRVL